MTNFLNNLLFVFQRLNWLSLLDILLVTLIFFVILYSLRDTQAMVLLRGGIILVVALVLLTTLVELPAFSWLIRSILPALLLSILNGETAGLARPQAKRRLVGCCTSNQNGSRR